MMTLRLTTQIGKPCLCGVVLAVLACTSSCGQIGPLYLPEEAGNSREQTEAPQSDRAEDDASKDSDEKPDSL